MEIKSFFISSLILWLLMNVRADTSCTLQNSKTGTCVDLHECKILKVSLDFINPDLLAEIKERMGKCSHINSKSVCCESEDLSSKVTDPVAPLNLQEIPPTMHKNYILFDNKKCGIPKPLNRVANGENAGFLQNPWAVRLGYKSTFNGISYGCGGTLITDRYVLTAAHCIKVTRSTQKLHSVRLGEYDETANPDCDPDDAENCADPYQDIIIETAIEHPDYDPVALIMDIGILRLSEPAKVNQNNIKPICLPFDETAKRLTEDYEVIGWGGTSNSSAFPILQKAVLPPYDNSMCEAKLQKAASRSNLKITSGQICAGGSNKVDACRGDSGGSLQSPAILKSPPPRMVQYGIVSYGISSCGQDSVPGVYTKVSKYLTWILDNMH